MRPLSFLSTIEDVIRQTEGAALPGDTMRAIDFRQGLARLQLTPDGDMIVVQCFELADGRDCLKAVIRWPDSDAQREVAVYPTESNRSTIWRESAERVARIWLSGAPEVAAPIPGPTGSVVGTEADVLVERSA